MNSRLATLTLSMLGGVATLLMSGASEAANVGYFGMCYPGTPAAQITAAGHTPVAITSANAASLVGISVLVAEPCGSLTDPGVAAAVANGMTLIVHDNGYSNGSFLPGAPNLVNGNTSRYSVDFEPGTPFLSGPGGTLTNSSLDNGSSSTHGDINRATLPAGSTVYATTGNTNQIVGFAYPHGTGKVYYSTIPLQCYLGTQCQSVETAAANKIYATNLIAWAAGSSFTTCAAAGLYGAKLTLCRQICELPQSPSTLSSLIKVYLAAFRENPPCAR